MFDRARNSLRIRSTWMIVRCWVAVGPAPHWNGEDDEEDPPSRCCPIVPIVPGQQEVLLVLLLGAKRERRPCSPVSLGEQAARRGRR